MNLSDKETDLLFRIFRCYEERVVDDSKVLGRYFDEIETKDKLIKNAHDLMNKITKEGRGWEFHDQTKD